MLCSLENCLRRTELWRKPKCGLIYRGTAEHEKLWQRITLTTGERKMCEVMEWDFLNAQAERPYGEDTIITKRKNCES